MSLKPLEDLWKTSLNEIMEQLDNFQYEKMILALDLIPRAVKTGKSRLDLTDLLLQYYGTIESIHIITKILDEIPRRDAAVQDPLRLAHQELEKYTIQSKSKTPVNQKPAAGKKKSCPPPDAQTKGKGKAAKETWKKSKSVDVDGAEPSCSESATSKRKSDETKAVEAKMMKDDSFLYFFPRSSISAAQRSEVKTQNTMNSDTVVYSQDPNKVVGVVQPQKGAVLQKQSSLAKVCPEERPVRMRLVVVKEVFKKKVYVFAEDPNTPGSIKELEVTPRRLALAFGLNPAEPDLKKQLHLQLPAYVHVQLNGKVIVRIQKNSWA